MTDNISTGVKLRRLQLLAPRWLYGSVSAPGAPNSILNTLSVDFNIGYGPDQAEIRFSTFTDSPLRWEATTGVQNLASMFWL